MDLYTVAKVDQLSELNPIIVDIGNTTISIYKFHEKYYAYENVCAHEGGPASEGRTLGELECKISPDGKLLEEHFSETNMNIVCPWHGIEYNVETGICRADSRLKLTSYEVVVEKDEIKVKVPT